MNSWVYTGMMILLLYQNACQGAEQNHALWRSCLTANTIVILNYHAVGGCALLADAL